MLIRELYEILKIHLNNFSFVYLDGSHESEDVNAELDYFLPRIARGGYLVIDNENWTQKNGKTKWENCLKDKFKREQHVHGVKVIYRKEQI